MPERFDVFISHASEDKNQVAFPLKLALERERLRVWLDHEELKLGESVPGSISDGLRDSRFAVVILSQNFLRKDWPKRELDAALDKVLPVLHGITHGQLQAAMPPVPALKSVS
jgi:hypothetical protein